MDDKLKQKLAHLPCKPGAYMMKDAQGEVIYVGKALSLRNRVRSYFQKGQTHLPRTVIMVGHIADIDWIVTDSEVEALMLECNLIKKYRPYYNVRLRDDKHYPYLCVTMSEPFPRVIITRRSKQDGNRYFGPYTDSLALRESLRLIRRIFRIRSCNKKLTGHEKDRPCLNLHLGQCDSPCSGAIAAEEYGTTVYDTCLFLEGRLDSIAKRIGKEMDRAAEALQFELAAKLRDQLLSIRKLTEKQKMINTDHIDRDIVCLLNENGSAFVQLLFIRSGRVIGQEQFHLDGVTDALLSSPESNSGDNKASDLPLSPELDSGDDNQTPELYSSENAEGQILTEFIKQYYRDAAYIPKEILVSHKPQEWPVLEDWLTLRRGNRVEIHHPQRGEKKRLVEMAQENAQILAGQRQDKEAQNQGNLTDLAREIGMETLPNRIEAFDISNLQGTETVASMVVFEAGIPAKKEYRRFKIRTVEGPDDYASMKEAIHRRFAAASDNPKFAKLPDLVVIDGGKGQLSAALEAIEERPQGARLQEDATPSTIAPESPCSLAPCGRSSITIISLAKQFEEVFLPGRSEPILLPRNSPALKLLQRIRDEAHRFALSYHHKLRAKTAVKSVLDSITGIGNERRKALIKRFGSLAGVRAASLDELQTVPGVNRKVAEAVYESLHGDRS